jgi:hypothetical protein
VIASRALYTTAAQVRSIAYKHPKFKAIDRVIGQNGLKFVTLLRLSPLLPLAASNYLYGLTRYVSQGACWAGNTVVSASLQQPFMSAACSHAFASSPVICFLQC